MTALAANFLFASGHDLQRCVEILLLSIVGLLFLYRATKSAFFAVPTLPVTLLLAFLGLGIASSSTAYSMRHAINEWSTLSLLIMLIFAIAAELASDVVRLQSLLRWTGIVCGLYSLKLIITYAAALATGYQVDIHSMAIGFSNARHLNHTQTALLPLIVLLCVQAPVAGAWRKVWFTLGTFWWALLFVCEARASFLALFVGCAAALVLRRSHARQFLVLVGWMALAGTLVYAFLFILLPVLAGLQPISLPLHVLERTAADPTSARNLLWKLAVELIATHPWLGVGPQHFSHYGVNLYAGAHPHNWPLQIAAEWGIPALLCLSCVIFFAARSLIQSGELVEKDDRVNQHILVALQVACTATFVDGLLSGVIVMPQSQLAIALVLGIAYGWVCMQGDKVQTRKHFRFSVTHSVCAIVVAAGTFGLVYSIVPDFTARARGDALTPAELAINPTTHWPRMWESGFF